MFSIPHPLKKKKEEKKEKGRRKRTSDFQNNTELRIKRKTPLFLHSSHRGSGKRTPWRRAHRHDPGIPPPGRPGAGGELRRSARLRPPTPAAAALIHEERSARSPPSPAAPCLPQPSKTRPVPAGLRRSSRPVPTDSPDSGEGGRDLKASVMTRGTCSSLSTYARPAGQLGAAFSP